jgi:hypothetical protein
VSEIGVSLWNEGLPGGERDDGGEGDEFGDVKWSLWGIVGVLDGSVLLCFVEATV